MNRPPKKGFQKKLLLGTLALTLSIPMGASAASAATNYSNNKPQVQIVSMSNVDLSKYNVSQYNIDLNAIIQQYQKVLQGNRNYPTISTPSNQAGNSSTVTKPNKPESVTVPNKPTTVTKPTETTTTVTKPNTTTNTNTSNNTVATSEFAKEVLTLVNQERSKAGLSALKMTNSALNQVALDKAKDMYNNGYFSHTSPTYGSPFDMMKQYGVSYSYAGENIAKGQTSPQAVMTAWMNSEGHRANILNANFTTIGIGYYNNVWVQAFIG